MTLNRAMTNSVFNEFTINNNSVETESDDEMDAVCDVLSDMIIDSFIESRKHLEVKQKLDIDIDQKKVEN